MSQPCREIALIVIPICPDVFSIPIRLITLEFSLILVSVAEPLLPKPILQIFSKLSFIYIRVVIKAAEAICFASFPVAFIFKFIRSFENTFPVSFSISPLAFILIAIVPNECTVALLFAILKFSFVLIFIGIYFNSLSMFVIVKPKAFVRVTISSYKYSHSVLSVVLGLAEVLIIVLY